jgi:hypothetical protein
VLFDRPVDTDLNANRKPDRETDRKTDRKPNRLSPPDHMTPYSHDDNRRVTGLDLEFAGGLHQHNCGAG